MWNLLAQYGIPHAIDLTSSNYNVKAVSSGGSAWFTDKQNEQS